MKIENFPNFDLDQFLRDHDIAWNRHDAEDHIEYAMNCPMCHKRGEPTPDTKKKLWFNLKGGAFVCYRCAWAGSTIKLIQTFAACGFETAIRILKGSSIDPMKHMNLSLVIEDVDYREDGEELKIPTVELPYGYLPIEGPHPYLEKRGIPWQYAARNDWGVSDAGYTKDRIIVPTFMNGELVFWQARATWEEPENKDFKKVLNPSGVSNRPILYNYDTAAKFDTIIIAEGFIDAAKIGDDAVATNGKRLHPQQVEMLLKTGAKKIVLMWDLDAWTDSKPRAKDKRTSIQRATDLLKSAGFEVYGAKMPDKKDPGSYKFKSKKLREIISRSKKL